LTLRIACANATEAADRVAQGASSRWELDALDYLETRDAESITRKENCLLARLGGPLDANAALAEEIKQTWPCARILDDIEPNSVWSKLLEFAWAHADGVLAKVPITLATLEGVASAVAKIHDARAHFSAGGNVAFVSLACDSDAAKLDADLRVLGLPALALRGKGTPAQLGASHDSAIAEGVGIVFDPGKRFAPLE
ncbi:MAG: hypothetical protein ABMA01_05020, partial [Chthoniobacteraceae bacterium]